MQSSHHRLDAAQQVVAHLLGSKARWGLAASPLLVGVVPGTVGSVPSSTIDQPVMARRIRFLGGEALEHKKAIRAVVRT